MSQDIFGYLQANTMYGRCHCCGKELELFNIKRIALFGEKLKYYYHSTPECETGMLERIDQLFMVEEYRGHKILERNGQFIPYYESMYYFDTLEDCKHRIDGGLDAKMAIVNMKYFSLGGN